MSGLFTRRMFLRRIGKGTAAVAVFGFAACGDDGAPATTAPAPGTTGTSATSTTGASPTTTAAPTTTTTTPTTTIGATATTWERVDLGFVSAYVVARGTEAAVVDTGVPGSAASIEAAVVALGLGWPDVKHVILTHFHGDHVGSIGDVLTNATAAVAYAGEADIPEIASPAPLTAVGDGDEVFGLQIVATPGHTPGHVSVYDPEGSVMVAGDALNGGDAAGGTAGEVAGPNPQFTPDMATAGESLIKLAQFDYQTLYFGHGSPVTSGAAAAVAALAAEL